jgi:hypothetical protein
MIHMFESAAAWMVVFLFAVGIRLIAGSFATPGSGGNVQR